MRVSQLGYVAIGYETAQGLSTQNLEVGPIKDRLEDFVFDSDTSQLVCACLYYSFSLSTASATPPKSTALRNPDSSVYRGTNSNWKIGPIWIFTEESRFGDLVDFRGVAFSVESVIVCVTPLKSVCDSTKLNTSAWKSLRIFRGMSNEPCWITAVLWVVLFNWCK